MAADDGSIREYNLAGRVFFAAMVSDKLVVMPAGDEADFLTVPFLGDSQAEFGGE